MCHWKDNPSLKEAVKKLRIALSSRQNQFPKVEQISNQHAFTFSQFLTQQSLMIDVFAFLFLIYIRNFLFMFGLGDRD